jgi:hypothetical protein
MFANIGALDNLKDTLRDNAPSAKIWIVQQWAANEGARLILKEQSGPTYLPTNYQLHLEVLPMHFFLAACEGNTSLWTSWNR